MQCVICSQTGKVIYIVFRQKGNDQVFVVLKHHCTCMTDVVTPSDLAIMTHSYNFVQPSTWEFA